MPKNLKSKSMLSMLEFSSDEIDCLITSAIDLKKMKRMRIFPKNLLNRNFALIFDKPSCRTRTSFVVAANDEGAHLEIFPKEDIRFGIKESVKDISKVLGRMFDGIAYRGDHDILEELAEYAGVPVWNGLSEKFHPTQALADLMTIKEKFGRYNGIKMAYIGDGRNNMVYSLIIASLKMGIDFRIISPKELSIPRQTLDEITKKSMGHDTHLIGSVSVTDDIKKGSDGCEIIYGDVWISMGEEDQTLQRIKLLKDYKVTNEIMNYTGNKDTIYLHCLPALHDDKTEISRKYPDIYEVSNDVFESGRSAVFEQAENRMHTIKALMIATV